MAIGLMRVFTYNLAPKCHKTYGMRWVYGGSLEYSSMVQGTLLRLPESWVRKGLENAKRAHQPAEDWNRD